MKTVSEQKVLLRKKLISQRKSFSLKEWHEKSELIKKHVLASKEFKNASIIHCFISINERFEVETHSLIEEALLEGKRIVVPVMNGNGTLIHSELTDLSELEVNKWGVPEPKQIKIFEINFLDLILVPLLGADSNGNRLGYGKGFYDRFLDEVKAVSFGMLFDEFIIEEIPIEPFDRKLNGLISEKGLTYT
ncbi:MAG: 5-formyltetrahydrofolate cyclo-ligase [Balneolaceae bacterium]